MIVAEELTKSFGALVAVDSVSFEAQAGEVVALLGHEGAGKTTVLRMLAGLVRPDAGSATILGKPYAALDTPARHAGVLLGTGAHPARSARDHLRLAAVRADLPATRVEDVLALVGLEDEAATRTRELGRGERHRLALAAALLGEPKVVILDDPAAGLDHGDTRWVYELLRALAHEGCAVLMTGRELSDAAHVADRVLVLDRGALIAPASTVPVRERAESSSADDAIEERSGSENGVGPTGAEPGDRPPHAEPGGAGPSHDEPDGAGPSHDEPDGPLAEAEASLDKALAALQGAAQARVVAVLAPGTGLGATTLAFLIADVLAAARPSRTLAVALSCDHERMSRPVAGDRRTSLGLGDLLDDLPEFDDRARISPYVAQVPSGADVLCGPSRARLATIEPVDVDALLAFAGRFYDTIVLDVGDLADAALRAVVRHADEVVLLGAPDAVDGLAAGDPVLDAIEDERAERATLVFNRVEEERVRELGDDGAFALVPRDRDLIRALDAGEFRLDDVGLPTRVALKRLALLVGERIS